MLTGRILAVLVSLLVFASCKKQPDSLTIYFTGDLLLDRGVRNLVERSDANAPFRKIKSFLGDADFVVANLECPVTKIKQPLSKRFVFRGEPEWLQAVADAHITHLVMANNHTNDQGRRGLIDTYKNVQSNGLNAVGFSEHGDNACAPVILANDSVHVALFASVLVPLENWSLLPGEPDVCRNSPAEIAEEVKAFKQSHPGWFAVVVLHWGVEFQLLPALQQLEQSKLLIDAGADAIIGHHPHVAQKTAVYKGKPVFFSLGNFVFDQQAPGDEALIAKMKFNKDGSLEYGSFPIQIKNCTPSLK